MKGLVMAQLRSSVTIEGSSINRSTALAPGQRRTVERTPYIDKLIKQGFVLLITDHGITPERVLGPEQTEAFLGLLTKDDGEDEGLAVVSVPADQLDQIAHVEAPSRRSSRSTWETWLNGVGIDYPGNATKAELIELWENRATDG